MNYITTVSPDTNEYKQQELTIDLGVCARHLTMPDAYLQYPSDVFIFLNGVLMARRVKVFGIYEIRWLTQGFSDSDWVLKEPQLYVQPSPIEPLVTENDIPYPMCERMNSLGVPMTIAERITSSYMERLMADWFAYRDKTGPALTYVEIRGGEMHEVARPGGRRGP